MDRRERDALDRYITGNYGEDQFRQQLANEQAPYDWDEIARCPECNADSTMLAMRLNDTTECQDCGFRSDHADFLPKGAE